MHHRNVLITVYMSKWHSWPKMVDENLEKRHNSDAPAKALIKSQSWVMSAFMALSLASNSALEAPGLSMTMCFPVVSPSHFLTPWSMVGVGADAGWGVDI